MRYNTVMSGNMTTAMRAKVQSAAAREMRANTTSAATPMLNGNALIIVVVPMTSESVRLSSSPVGLVW